VTSDDLGTQEALVARFTRTRTFAVAAVGALLLTLPGCNGSDPESGPTASPEAASSSAAGSASSSPTTSSEPSPSSSVAAATGPLLEIPDAVQMNAPAGWKQSEDIVTFKTEANPPGGGSAARLGALGFPGAPPSLDDHARSAMKGAGADVKRLPDIEVGGEQFFQLAGPLNPLRYTVMLGTTARGYQVSISFDFSPDFSAEDRDRLVDESLATFAWK
jgi:hypothetical protein